MPESADDDDGFRRCRFTLTKDVHQVLENRADAEYAGNKSALVRAAIREKAERPSVNEIRVELNRIRTLIEEELEGQGSGQDGIRSPHRESIPNRANDVSVDIRDESSSEKQTAENPARVARELIEILPDTDEDPITLAEVDEKVDVSLDSLTAAIKELKKRGEVEQLNIDGSIAYQRGVQIRIEE